MQIHQLKPKNKLKKKKRIGRGGKRGTYAGRGIKGQKARAGAKMQPVIRELIKKYPKLRGYRFKSKVKTQKSEVVILNLDVLDKKFKDGEKITPNLLLKRKLISKIKGKIPLVKILGRGELSKKFTIEECQLSESARKKIEKVGGKII